MATSDDTGTYVGDADTGIPADTATRTKGAAEIRQVKIQLDNTFPNFVGAAVNTTEAEINMLDGIATGGDNVETRLSGVETDVAAKADKISGGVEDNIVTIDASENIKDSGTTIASLAADPFVDDYLHVIDQKTAGTNGGTFTDGAWQTRTLQTEKTNTISGASLASSQITLPAGTYLISASAPAQGVGQHAIRLYNVTDGAVLLDGTTEWARQTTGATVQNRSILNGRFTLAASKVLELQHRCSVTVAAFGFGSAASFVANEVYSEVQIWKLN